MIAFSLRCLALALFLFSCFPPRAGELIPPSSPAWRLFKGRTEASSPVDGWRQPAFDDANWSVAATPVFYGEPVQGGTLLTDMANQYSSFCLRRGFSVANLAAVQTLSLDVKCDDGFAAWINGRLVASYNTPATLAFNSLAPAAAPEPAQSVSYPIASPGTVLREGQNVLAIQVFNVSRASSDILLDAQLFTTEKESIAPTLAAIGPFPGPVTNLTQVTVTFSEPVQGVTASALRINDRAARTVTGSGTTYTFTFDQPPYGSVQFSWSIDSAIADLAVPPNRFERNGANATFLFDLVDPAAPYVSAVQPPPGAAVRSLREISVTFSRPVSGVDPGDLQANGVAATGVSGLGAGPYLFAIPAMPDGPVEAAWTAAPGIVDEDGKPFEPGGWSYTLASGQVLPRVRIHELDAANINGLKDEDASAEDWIELHNAEDYGVNLAGWSITDRADNPGQWIFPAVTIPARGYLIVFASSKDRATAGRLHANFKLGGDGEYLGLFSPDAPRTEVSALEFPEQRNDISYGVDQNNQWRYLRTPTPGSPNASATVEGIAEPVHFSVRRGFFSAPFELTLHSPTPGAVVRYTMNGSEPTETTGTNYTGPIRIDRSRVLRAAAFSPNRLPSKTATHTYLFYIPTIRTRLPVLSLVTASNYLYGATGIMETTPRNTTKRGPAWERPVSVEFIRPQDNEGFQIDCGIRLQGGDYIRGLYNYRSSSLPESKYSYRLYFRGDYGAGKLNYPLIRGLPFESFDEISLRAGMNDHSNPFIRDSFLRELSSEVGIVASHGTFVHLYLNGVYKGLYNPSERIGPEFLQQWHGGGDQWDIVAQSNELVEGDMVVWNRLRSLTTSQNPTNQAVYLQVQTMLDVENFIDYLLPHIYADTDDWPHNNWRGARERTPEGKFRFYSWDAEFSFGYNGVPVSHNTIAGQLSSLSPPWGTTEIQRLFTRLKLSPEFRLHFADRVHKHFFNGGALTDERIRASYQRMKAEVAPSISGFNDTIGTAWIPQRRRYVTNHLNSAGFLASSNAPVFSQFGGRVPRGYPLQMTAGTGEIYYTTNGADPRVPFTGAVLPGAARYAGPVAIGESTIVKARTRWNQTNWSAVTEMTFQVAQLGIPLRITELMYHPPGGDAFEFIELRNLGGTPLSLANFSFDGVTFRFGTDEPPLGAGESLILASGADLPAFRQRYPNVVVRGTFSGSLANGGERIAIEDAQGNIVTAVEYDDENGWPAAADGGGSSLELLDANGDPSAPANWAASATPGGSPGAANGGIAPSTIRLNEIFAGGSPDSGGDLAADWLELFNSAATEADLSGWSLTDDSNPRRFVFPPNTRLAAQGYLRVWCDAAPGPGLRAPFALGQRGETVALFDSRTNRIDAISFGLQIPGYSVGRGEADGAWTLTAPSPGAPNEAVNLAADLALNEVLANPPPGQADWLELHNPDTNAPAGLGGYYLVFSNAVSRLPALSFISPGGYTRIWADEISGPDHVSFKLPASGGVLVLADPLGAEINRVTWPAQREGVSTGRLPNGTGLPREFPFSASPGAENYLPAQLGLRLNEVLARPAAGQAGWIELANVSDQPVALRGHSLGLNRARPGDWNFPDATLPAQGLLLVGCDPARPADGVNTGMALNDQGGSVYFFDPAGRLIDFVEFGAQAPGRSIGYAGNGWMLTANATPGTANEGPAPMGNPAALRLNEWLAEPLAGDDWIEIFNPQELPVDLGGLSLTDDPSIHGRTNSLIAPLTFAGPRGFVLLQADAERDKGPEHTAFKLDAFGETLRLYSGIGIVDEVVLLPQAPGVSEGRSPDGAEAIARFPGRPTPRASNPPLTADADGDGLPDDWETAHGLNPGDSSDAQLDGDQDGHSNLAEFRAGTDPRNFQSALRVAVVRNLDGTSRIVFPAAADRSYSILASGSLAFPTWQRLRNIEAGPARTVELSDALQPGQAARFYRVVTPLLP